MRKLIFFILFGISINAFAQTKRALIVAIGNYPKESGWDVISSINDAVIIKDALQKQGFTNILIIKDQEATKSGIIKAFEQLINNSQVGDKIVIHFSSHGRQVDDDNNDELDGQDEAIVCYGAVKFPTNMQEANQNLRDDEIGKLIQSLRAELGKNGDVLMLVDACSSATLTRGNVRVRGNIESKSNENTQKNINNQKVDSFLYDTPADENLDKNGISPYVAIAAAQPGQLNFELKDEPLGSLSFCVQKVFTNLKKGFTYQDVFNDIVTVMKVIAPQQTPQIEGSTNRELFGGKVEIQESYFTLTRNDKNEYFINGGKLYGIYEGSKLVIVPIKSKNSKIAQIITTATVENADYLSAQIKLEKTLKNTDYWVFVKEKSFNNTISVAVSQKVTFKDSLENRLKKLHLVKIVEKNLSDLVIEPDSVDKTKVHVMVANDGFIWGEKAISENEISRAIQQYSQYIFLQNLQMNNEELDLRIELVPSTSNSLKDTLYAKKRVENGQLVMREGEYAFVRVTNKSAYDKIYFNVIDIEPFGKINAIFPCFGKDCQEANVYVINHGKSIVLPERIKFSKPYGKETFMIIAAREPFDMRKVIGEGNTRGTNGVLNHFEKVFGTITTSTTRGKGGQVEALPSDGNMNIYKYNFMIMPKQ